MKWTMKPALVILGLFLVWFCIHIIVITLDGLNDQVAHTDVAVVLGNKVEPDGHPSQRLQGRLNKALELYTNHLTGMIIVSGGIDPAGFDEAQVMKTYLVNHGVPAASILVDSQGKNTRATALNTKILMDQNGLKSVIIVTQFYHITRSKLAFRQAGIKVIYHVHARFVEWRDIYFLIREFVGFYRYLLY